MENDRVTLKIPRPLYEKLKTVIEGSGFVYAMTVADKFIKAGQGKDQALRSAQLAALGSADTAHPYYWAGVILNGDCQ